MPTATVTVTEVPAADVAAPPRSRKKLFLVIGLVVLLLGVGGFFAKGLLGGSASGRARPEDRRRQGGDALAGHPQPGRRALPQAHPRRCSSARRRGWRPAAVGEGAAVAPTVDGAKALDAAIDVLGRRTYAQLLATGGRASAQKALSAEVRKRYDGDVLRVYFRSS